MYQYEFDIKLRVIAFKKKNQQPQAAFNHATLKHRKIATTKVRRFVVKNYTTVAI